MEISFTWNLGFVCKHCFVVGLSCLWYNQRMKIKVKEFDSGKVFDFV